MLVVSDGRLVGIVSEEDLLRREEIGTAPNHSWLDSLLLGGEDRAAEFLKTRGRRVADVMSPEVITVKRTTDVREIVDLLEEHRVKRVVAAEGRKPVGIVSRRDVIRALVATEAKRIEVSLSAEQMRQIAMANIALAGLHAYAIDLKIAGTCAEIAASVPSDQVGRALIAAVADTPGVKLIKSNIVVQPPQVPLAY